MNRSQLKLVGVAGALALALSVGTLPAGEEASALGDTSAKGYLGVFLGVRASPEGKDQKDVVVVEILPGSPAEKAGLQAHDVIVKASDNSVTSLEDARGRIQACKPGETLRLTVRRGGETKDIDVVLGALPAVPPGHAPGHAPSHAPVPGAPRREPAAKAPGAFLGVGFAPVPAEVAYHLGLSEDLGVMVGEVLKGSPAEKAGIGTHDVLLTLDGKEIRSPESLSRLVEEKKPGDAVKIELFQKGVKKTVEVTLGERPLSLQGEELPFGAPEGRRGRLRIFGPDGLDREFMLPRGFFDHEEVLKSIRDRFPELGHPEELSSRLKGLFESLKGKDDDSLWSSSESRTAVVRMMDGEHDITVTDQNGVRTVTVKKGNEVIAKDLPYDQVKTLPKEVQEKVEKAAEGMKDSIRVKIHGDSKSPVLPLPSDDKSLKT